MIYVEDRRSAILVRVVTGLPRQEVVLEGPKGNVVRRIMGTKGALAVVDEDPNSVPPRHLASLPVVYDLEDVGLKVLRGRRGNRVVVLRPRLEEWVLKAAAEEGIAPGTYGLPRDARELHKDVSHRTSEGFERMVRDLVKSRRLRALRRLLRTRRRRATRAG